MIPGPYVICAMFVSGDADFPSFRTLSYGYDSASAAFAAIEGVAKESGVALDDCTVVRPIDPDEADDFED